MEVLRFGQVRPSDFDVTYHSARFPQRSESFFIQRELRRAGVSEGEEETCSSAPGGFRPRPEEVVPRRWFVDLHPEPEGIGHRSPERQAVPRGNGLARSDRRYDLRRGLVRRKALLCSRGTGPDPWWFQPQDFAEAG